MRKGFKWLVAALFVALIVMVLYPIVMGWFVMM